MTLAGNGSIQKHDCAVPWDDESEIGLPRLPVALPALLHAEKVLDVLLVLEGLLLKKVSLAG